MIFDDLVVAAECIKKIVKRLMRKIPTLVMNSVKHRLTLDEDDEREIDQDIVVGVYEAAMSAVKSKFPQNS